MADSSTPAAPRLPRRPKEYRQSAVATSAAADTVVAIAPSSRRSADVPVSTLRNACRLIHVIPAAAVAATAAIQPSSRTLIQAGRKGSADRSSATSRRKYSPTLR